MTHVCRWHSYRSFAWECALYTLLQIRWVWVMVICSSATYIFTFLYTFTRCSQCQVMHSRWLSLGTFWDWGTKQNSCDNSVSREDLVCTCHVVPATLHCDELCSCFGLMQVNFIAGKLLSYAPQPVAVVLRQLVTDVQNIIDLQPSTNGVARILVYSTQFFYLTCCAGVYID